MKSRHLLCCLAASLFTLPGCQSAPSGSPAPAARRLVKRNVGDRCVPVRLGDAEPRCPVERLNGGAVCRHLRLGELETKNPEPYRLGKGSVAIDAGNDRSPASNKLRIAAGV